MTRRLARSQLSPLLVATALASGSSGCRGGTNAAPPPLTNAPTAEAKSAPTPRGAMTLPTVRVVLDVHWKSLKPVMQRLPAAERFSRILPTCRRTRLARRG